MLDSHKTHSRTPPKRAKQKSVSDAYNHFDNLEEHIVWEFAYKFAKAEKISWKKFSNTHVLIFGYCSSQVIYNFFKNYFPNVQK
jgi:hypothetical protein